jgi:hypothetical protein
MLTACGAIAVTNSERAVHIVSSICTRPAYEHNPTLCLGRSCERPMAAPNRLRLAHADAKTRYKLYSQFDGKRSSQRTANRRIAVFAPCANDI